MAVRIELEGATDAHRSLLAQKHHWANEIRSLAIDVGKGDIWVEKVKFRTSNPTLLKGSQPDLDGALGELHSLFTAARSETGTLNDLSFDLSDVMKKLPAELKDRLQTDDPAWLRSVLDEAESRLFNQLLVKEEDE